MADWNYDQFAIRSPEDREEIVRRINFGWELVGLTLRGRGGRNVVHAIMRSRRPDVPKPVPNRRAAAAAKRTVPVAS